MSSWADDPELVATFRAEVEERLASLCEGLLRLEAHPSPRQLVAGLFRDAHTVKGSARMLGLDGVVDVAHRAEDLLGALRDGPAGRPQGPGRPAARRRPRASAARCRVPTHPVGADELAAARRGARRAPCAGDDPVDRAPAGHRATRPIDRDDAARPRGRRLGPRPHPPGPRPARRRRRGRAGRAPGRPAGPASSRRWPPTTPRAAAPCASRWPAPTSTRRRARRAARAWWRSATSWPPPPASCASRVEDAQGRLGRRPRRRDGPGDGAGAPGRRRLPAARPRAVAPHGRPARTSRLVLDGRGRRARHPGARRASPTRLRHLVTNAVDHGCETPAERIARRQAAAGDGHRLGPRRRRRPSSSRSPTTARGVDEDAAARGRRRAAALLPADSDAHRRRAAAACCSRPASRTRDEVTETSGRGVGLDVVRTWSRTSAAPSRCAPSPGVGTTFVLTPAGDARRAALPASPGSATSATPCPCPASSRRSACATPSVHERGRACRWSSGTARTCRWSTSGRRSACPASATRAPPSSSSTAAPASCWPGRSTRSRASSSSSSRTSAPSSAGCPTVAGATIDGDGSVVLLLDVRELAVRQLAAGGGQAPATPAAPPSRRTPAAAAGPVARPRVLVVEDSVGVRELQRVILEGAGYDVVTAVDGLDGAARLERRPGRPGALRRRDAGHGRLHADPHASGAPAAGRTCPS